MQKSITLPAKTIEYIDEPVSLEYALDNLGDDARFTATVRLRTFDITDPDSSYDVLYDNLCDSLITGAQAFSMTFKLVGVDIDPDYVFVRLSNDVIEMLSTNPIASAWGISEDQLEQVMARFPATR